MKIILIMMFSLMMSGCTLFSSEPIPHRSVYSETNLETIWFNFPEEDRYTINNLEASISFYIHNGAQSSLRIDTEATLQAFDSGWNDIGELQLTSDDVSYLTLEEDGEDIVGSVNLSELDMDFEPGRYRLIITLDVSEETSELSGQQQIGKVFWLQE